MDTRKGKISASLSEFKEVRRIVDIHAHVGTTPDGRSFSPEQLVAAMNTSKVSYALISGLAGILGAQPEANREASEAARRFPGRLGCLVWVDPSQGLAALKDAQNWIARKEFLGFKFHPFYNRFYFNDPLVYPFLKLASDLQVPVLVNTAHDEFSLPVRALDMALKYPDVPIIMGHAGWADGPHKSALNLQAMIMASMVDNLYLDTSRVDGAALIKGLGFLPKGRVMFGADAPLGGTNHYGGILEAFEQMNLKQEDKDEIFHLAADRIFKISLSA